MTYQKNAFLALNFKFSIFRWFWYFYIKPRYPIPVCHADDIGSGPSSLAPIILELEYKIEFDQFGQFLPISGISKPFTLETLGSYI
jgi:hypothetical protein